MVMRISMYADMVNAAMILLERTVLTSVSEEEKQRAVHEAHEILIKLRQALLEGPSE